MFGVKENITILIKEQNTKNAHLLQILSCLKIIDTPQSNNFYSLDCEFSEIYLASKFIVDFLRKEKINNLTSFVQIERQRLEQFAQITKKFDSKELQQRIERTIDILNDIDKWCKDHCKQNVLSIENSICLLA
ncbi:hypothetical protein IJJ97_03875 [bacterium]|nr:hypothetical protein [bacterium]